jgi:hypothetical protein
MHRAHGRSRLHDFRSGLEDRGLEGIRDPHCRRYLDRLAVAGLILELRNAAGGRAARHPESGRRLIESILTVHARGLLRLPVFSLRGMAGAGKTATLREVQRGLSEAGHTVFVVEESAARSSGRTLLQEEFPQFFAQPVDRETLSRGEEELNDRLAAISPTLSPFGRTWLMGVTDEAGGLASLEKLRSEPQSRTNPKADGATRRLRLRTYLRCVARRDEDNRRGNSSRRLRLPIGRRGGVFFAIEARCGNVYSGAWHGLGAAPLAMRRQGSYLLIPLGAPMISRVGSYLPYSEARPKTETNLPPAFAPLSSWGSAWGGAFF